MQGSTGAQRGPVLFKHILDIAYQPIPCRGVVFDLLWIDDPAFVVWERVSEGRKTKGNDATHIPSSPKVLCYDAESFLVGP